MSSENDNEVKVNDSRAALNRHLDQILAQPVSPNLTAIAALYSAYDMATMLMRGDPRMGMKWMRGALDLLQRDLDAQFPVDAPATNAGGGHE